MSDSNITRGRDGLTMVTGATASNNGLGLVGLRGSDGFDRVLWVDTNGKLRIADIGTVEGSTFNPDADGTVVGTQT